MTFELWDTVTRNIIGAYDTEADALAVVSAAIRAHGPAYADPIALVRDDPDGDVLTLALGPDLARRAASPLTPRLDIPDTLGT